MFKYEHIKADYKQIIREPMMILLYLVPILLLTMAKIGLIILPKYLSQYFSLDILSYSPYILACTLSMIFLMVGTATGFMMIDDKDAKIFELMQVTPLGRRGYLLNRLLLPVVMTFFYSMAGWLLLDLNEHILIGLMVSLLISMETILIGILLFYIADDKVQGLTYAKGLNFYVLITLVPLIDVPVLYYLVHLLPVFWITKLITSTSFLTLFGAVAVHFIWLVLFIGIFNRGE